MFDLEQAVSDWRRQMRAARIETDILEELESHLRDDVGQRVQAGESAPEAFDRAAREIGEGPCLKFEFARAGETLFERWRRLIRAPAGILNYQLATNMNTQPHEPGWATYLKSAALILPAIIVWIGSLVFVVPKLKQICAATSTGFPTPVILVLTASQFVHDYFIFLAVGSLAALALLERRSLAWPRYRRWVFGAIAFSVNLLALALMAVLVVFAVIAASHLLPPGK